MASKNLVAEGVVVLVSEVLHERSFKGRLERSLLEAHRRCRVHVAGDFNVRPSLR